MFEISLIEDIIALKIQNGGEKMHKNYYDGPPEYRPLSAWEYFGYGLLIAIPIVGFVMMLYYSFDNSNINRRNFARYLLCNGILVLVFGVFWIGINYYPK